MSGLECSYYNENKNIALHTDLCSPLATDPTWSRLAEGKRTKLELDGTKLWHNLVEHLAPDVIIISVAEKYLKKIKFSHFGDWKTIYTIQRKNPYKVKSSKMKIADNTNATAIFGRAANTPFGTVSSKDKGKIGLFVKEHIYGK